MKAKDRQSTSFEATNDYKYEMICEEELIDEKYSSTDDSSAGARANKHAAADEALINLLCHCE